jgi:hypothetical protein
MYQLRKDWQGLMVCSEDWEPRHPQDFLRTRPERGGVPISRPEPEDINILTTCDFWSSSPMADFGTADCMTVGGNTSIDLLIETYGASSRAGIAIAGRSISGVL